MTTVVIDDRLVDHSLTKGVKVVYPSLKFKSEQETAVKNQAGFQTES